MESGHGVYHLGLAVIDFNLVSSIQNKLGPVWEGIWTDLRILKILKGMVSKRERCFAVVLNCNNQIELWESIPGSKFDATKIPINWSFELPSYNCGNSDQFKRLETSRFILNNVVGNVSGTVKYRTDQNPCWQDWDTFSACALMEDCCSTITTTTTGEFALPGEGQNIQILVENSQGMTVDQPDITIGGFSVTLLSIDSPIAITIQNPLATQVGGLVANATLVTFCGFKCTGPSTYREQQRTPIRLHMPPENPDPISGHFSNRGYEFQPKIENTGSFEIRQVRIYTKDESEILGADRRNPV